MINQAIVLAAGSGLRLKPLTDRAPKCLTEVNGVPILLNTLRCLSALGIRTCTLVVGHLSSIITEFVGQQYEEVRVEYIFNERYAETNDMYSLWLARENLEDGVLLLEGDIFFRRGTLAAVLNAMPGKSCYVSGPYNGRADEILLQTNRNRRVRSVEVLSGRSAARGRNRYMSSGILLIQPEYGKALSSWLGESVEAGRTDILFDAVIAEHIGELPLHICRIEQDEWVEIDTIGDLERAERVFGENISEQ
jgi:choline kinase